jgi:hypothetical protein
MVSTLQDEQVLPVKKAPKYIPGNVSTHTAWRWATRGVRGIKLESMMVGGTRVTSREAIDRFLSKLNPESVPTTDEADAELSVDGI